MSRIGNQLIALPDKVKVTISDSHEVAVEGPRGKLSYVLPEQITFSQADAGLRLSRATEDRRIKALHGTARSLISNMVQGVNEGFSKELEIIGVGFRAAVKGGELDLSLGYSHPVLHPIPSDLKVTVTETTKIRVEGIDKQRVGQFAAEVRSYYPPEPYKGKGVRYVGEYVRRKAGKSVQ